MPCDWGLCEDKEKKNKRKIVNELCVRITVIINFNVFKGNISVSNGFAVGYV